LRWSTPQSGDPCAHHLRKSGKEITPYAGVSVDEGPRADTSPATMAKLPTLIEGGVLMAAVASQISDGAAALLIASQDA
jgi:acetyl-CoA C-acetyltransferase